MPRRNPDAEPAVFVRVWQTSKTIHEVCERLNMKMTAAYERARRYRAKGIPLVMHGGVQELDVAALAALAASLRKIA